MGQLPPAIGKLSVSYWAAVNETTVVLYAKVVGERDAVPQPSISKAASVVFVTLIGEH